MTFARLATGVTAAAATLLITVAGAFAAPATANTAANVRSGPGTNYRVVGVLQRGDRVEVDECRDNWCYVSGRADGWVSASLLDQQTAGRPGPNQPGINFGITIGPDGQPSVNFGIGQPNQPPRPGPRPRPEPVRGEACFYERANFQGRSFCARPGETQRRLSRDWNDRIQSVTVTGGVTAEICSEPNLRGACATVTRDVRNLGRLARDVSSFEVSGRGRR